MLDVLKNFRDDTVLGCSIINRTHILDTGKRVVDIEQLQQNIKTFFLSLNNAITIQQIENLKSLVLNLKDYYLIDEQYGICQYDLTAKNESDLLQLSCYGNRIYLDLNFDNLKFTQHQILDTIYQTFSTKFSNFSVKVYKCYDMELNLIECQINFDSIEKDSENTVISSLLGKFDGYSDKSKKDKKQIDRLDVEFCIGMFIGKSCFISAKSELSRYFGYAQTPATL